MDDFYDIDLPDDGLFEHNPKRLDAEWTTLSAIREMLGISLKGRFTPTYEQALAVGKELAPELFDSQSTLLGKGKEQQIVQEYRQRAEAQSRLDGRQVSPIKIIDEEIKHFDDLLKAGGQRDLLQRRLNFLRKVRSLLRPKKYTENQLIIRDLFKAKRNLPNPPVEGDTYREYQLSEDRGLRIRLLHPDPPEHSMGADLIYEHYWDKKSMARLAVIQYKIRDGYRRVLYLSKETNLEKQLVKLQTIFCNSGLCQPFENSVRANAYRLPFCSVFLRPTDALQQPDSRLISSGLHVPVCVALRVMEDTEYGNKKIVGKNFRSEALSHKVFEELFNANMLGSRWMTYKEVEDLYQEHKILEPDETIKVHAQEFGIS